MSDNKLVSVTATQHHIDITAGKTYPVYYRGGVAKFKDDAGDQRTVKDHTDRRSFLVRNYETEPFPDWSKAPSWANYFCIEGGGHTYWLRDYPKPWVGSSSRKQYERGVVPGGREGVTWAHTADPVVPNWGDRLHFFTKPGLCRGTIAHQHTGTQPIVTTSPKEQTVPKTTPQSEAQYIIRVLSCQNPDYTGRYVTIPPKRGGAFFADLDRPAARRFTYGQVLAFLRERQEHRPIERFEVILDKVKTGFVKPKPKPKGNAGFSVGDKVRCTLSAHSSFKVGDVYEVVALDGDGDEKVRLGRHDSGYLKWGKSSRNEYTKVED